MFDIPRSEKFRVIYLSLFEGLIVGVIVYILRDVWGLWVLLIAPLINIFSPIFELLYWIGMDYVAFPIYYFLLFLFLNFVYKKYENVKAVIVAYLVLFFVGVLIIFVALSQFNPVFL